MLNLVRRAWAAWLRLMRIVGHFQARVVLTVFYFVAIVPVGVGLRVFLDPLRLKRANGSCWLGRGRQDASLEEARKQS
ncbi:MAG: hypothetical protein HYX92_21330 [Chloroflexi bacterium]|nr:hypothetical protein [Chloroflexota bacterium]